MATRFTDTPVTVAVNDVHEIVTFTEPDAATAGKAATGVSRMELGSFSNVRRQRVAVRLWS